MNVVSELLEVSRDLGADDQGDRRLMRLKRILVLSLAWMLCAVQDKPGLRRRYLLHYSLELDIRWGTGVWRKGD